MENNNNNNNKPIQGWKDVNMDVDVPLSVVISFLNVMNQRLCLLEDHVTVTLDDGRTVTVTELFKLQEEAAKAAQTPTKEGE